MLAKQSTDELPFQTKYDYFEIAYHLSASCKFIQSLNVKLPWKAKMGALQTNKSISEITLQQNNVPCTLLTKQYR